MNLKRRFVWALILIDMLSGDEYFALSGCGLASSPPPSCVYRGGSQSVVRGPPVVAQLRPRWVPNPVWKKFINLTSLHNEQTLTVISQCKINNQTIVM